MLDNFIGHFSSKLLICQKRDYFCRHHLQPVYAGHILLGIRDFSCLI